MKEALPLIWRRIPERYNLIGSFCENCGTPYFPKRVVCPKCRRHGKLVKQKMPPRGKIISFTQVHNAPSGFGFEVPYYIAIIELENGARVLSQVAENGKNVEIGARVEMVFRKIFEDDAEGVIAYGYKFKVV